MGPDRAKDLLPAVLALVAESLRAGWPARDIVRVLASLPRRHSGPYFSMVRRLGSQLRQRDPWATGRSSARPWMP
eukprot:6088849-Alexandrium_andersonii.AAC.1